jgi:hypothetical protein
MLLQQAAAYLAFLVHAEVVGMPKVVASQVTQP